jgi:hypothetical protein
VAIQARRALVGLVTTAAVLALPAVAAAAPLLTVTPSTTTAGTSPATVTFNSTFSTAPNDVTFALPAGLLANANQGGGACLAATSLTTACQVGSGTATAAGTPNVPVNLYLVPAPAAGDAAGVALVQGSNTLSTAAVTVRSTDGGLNVTFSNLAGDAITALDVSLTTLRMPSSCPTTPANVTLTADGASTTAPLPVTGCSGLTYQPALTASLTKDAHDQGGELVLGITQGATEAPNSSITLGLGSAITPNVSADLPCLAGTTCTIGTATATSPLLPSPALASGTVTLSGNATTPTIAVVFPAPFALTIDGAVNLANNSVTFSNIPDLPLTNLTLTVTGPNGQKAFNIVSCSPAKVTGSFTGQGGQSATSSPAIQFSNCATAPKASGSSSGLATGHPSLKVKVSKSSGGANIASLAVALPSGLSFAKSAISTHKTCTTSKGKKKCTTTTLIKGLGVSGASVKSVALKGGKLVITLKKAAGSVTVSLSGPVLSESKALQTKVKKHKTKTVTVSLKVTDAKHTTSSVPVKITAH